MAAGDTVITVTGNLTDNPELRYTSNGVALAKVRIASTARYFDKASNAWKDGDPLFMPCTMWRELAENAAESLTKGMRVVATGRLRQSHWETDTGEKRSMMQLDVDEIGPSLRFATAKVQKLTRTSGGNGRGEDPWASASPTRPADAAGTPAGSGGGFDDEPPF
jgi:single-strand DNA-binding protein